MQNGTTDMAANSERFFASHLESGKIRADMKDFLVAKLERVGTPAIQVNAWERA